MSGTVRARSIRIAAAVVKVAFALSLITAALVIARLGAAVLQGGDSYLYGETGPGVSVQLRDSQLDELPPNVGTPGTFDAVVSHPNAGVFDGVIQEGRDLGTFALVVASLLILHRFMRSVLQGEPFGTRNVRRLRILGVLLLLGGPVASLLHDLLQRQFLDRVPNRDALTIVGPGYDFPEWAVVSGLAALVLAEVFAYGRQLEEDVEATI